MFDEALQRLLQIQHLRTLIDDRQVDDAERRLHVRQAEQLVQHDLREHVLLQLQHQAHAVTVALVARFLDALDALVTHQLADLGMEARLVHLVR